MMMRLALPTTLFLAALARPTAAQPAEEESPRVDAARRHFSQAVKLAAEGRWAEARDGYERSLALKSSPRTLYSLAVAQRNTGRLVEALASFRAFLRHRRQPDLEPYRRAALRAVRELHARVARVHLRLEPPVPSASVVVDGRQIPRASELVLDPGVHLLEVRAAGYHDHLLTFEVDEGERREVEALLTPDGAGGGPPLIPVSLVTLGSALLTAGVTTGVVGVVQAQQDRPDANVARTKAVAGDVIAAAGALTLGVGVSVWLLPDGSASAGLAPAPGATVAF